MRECQLSDCAVYFYNFGWKDMKTPRMRQLVNIVCVLGMIGALKRETEAGECRSRI